MVPGLVWELSIRFRDRSQRSVVRLGPHASGRQLELPRQGLPLGASRLVRARPPEQEQRVPACLASRSVSQATSEERKRMKQPGEAVAEQASQADSIRWSTRKLQQSSRSGGDKPHPYDKLGRPVSRGGVYPHPQGIVCRFSLNFFSYRWQPLKRWNTI